MLSSFSIQNFRSILELQLDFTYGEGKAPNGYQEQETMPFLETTTKHRLVPCLAFFGPNASGKSNILKAFGALEQLVRKGGQLFDLYEPNRLNSKFSDTAFAIEFIMGDDRLEYRLTYNAKEIKEESLLKNGKAIYAIHRLKAEFSHHILSATYSKEKLSEILRVECSDGGQRQTKPFLHRIGLAYLGLHGDLRNAFSYFKDHLILYHNEAPILLPVSVDILAADLGGDEKAALREITDVVRRLDIDIATIEITHRELPPHDNTYFGLTQVNHKTGKTHAVQVTSTRNDSDGQPTSFDFGQHESAGTQRLAGLVGLILHVLKTGGVLLVDELECSLHPLLMREIVIFFKKRRHNPLGAQLIFTTHNTDILDDSILRLSEIVIVRKTVANGTIVRRLVDAKADGEDIRNVTNFRKQYLAGFYSGVPHPAL